MKLYIDSSELELLLERKRAYIGNKETNVVSIVDAALLIFSVGTTAIDSSRVMEVVIKTVFGVVALANILLVLWQMRENRLNHYDKDMLLKDIEALDMKERRSSIIAITNPTNARKFLVYYDPQWNFLLFPNYTTNDLNNESNIKERLARDLDLSESDVTVSFRNRESEQKFATAHNEVRAYEYCFYKGDVHGIKDKDFEIDGRRYQWKTIQELLNDPETKAHNEFIVEHIGKSF